MHGKTQLRWIAEAEARCLKDLAVSQGDRVTSAIEAARPDIPPFWRMWLARTMSRVSLSDKHRAVPEQDRRR